MTRRYTIEIAASSSLELAELMTTLAAHILKRGLSSNGTILLGKDPTPPRRPGWGS